MSMSRRASLMTPVLMSRSSGESVPKLGDLFTWLRQQREGGREGRRAGGRKGGREGVGREDAEREGGRNKGEREERGSEQRIEQFLQPAYAF